MMPSPDSKLGPDSVTAGKCGIGEAYRVRLGHIIVSVSDVWNA
jgi:hypothetical protein